MIVVSDTTAVTTLVKAGRERLLFELFGKVIVPQAVWDELLAFHSQLPDFISLRPVAVGGGSTVARNRTIGAGRSRGHHTGKRNQRRFAFNR